MTGGTMPNIGNLTLPSVHPMDVIEEPDRYKIISGEICPTCLFLSPASVSLAHVPFPFHCITYCCSATAGVHHGLYFDTHIVTLSSVIVYVCKGVHNFSAWDIRAEFVQECNLYGMCAVN